MKRSDFFHQPAVLKGITLVLWLISSALALFALSGAADVVATVYAAFWAEGVPYGEAYQGAVALRQMVVMFGSILACVVIIGGLEYTMRHINSPTSWRFFARVLGVEAGILLLAGML
ncbi:MAG TPA: hypothetical protein PLJ78_15260 [Anaerolineae bacterium]|nr:hypothetical protein [Anaerolineae bacterium]HQK15291.1 hypothetical protein [Anaerolineae bacterium]